MQNDLKKTLKIPIGLKLVTVIAILLVTSTLIVVFTATHLFTEDNTALIQSANSDSANQLGQQVFDYFEFLAGEVTSFVESKFANSSRFFERRDDVSAVAVWKLNASKYDHFASRSDLTLGANAISKLLIPSKKSWSGEMTIERALINGKAFVSLSIPLTLDSNKKVIEVSVALINQDRLAKIFGKQGVVLSYLIDGNGNPIAHPDPKVINSEANWKSLEIVKALQESTVNNGQLRFFADDQKPYLGAFRQVGIGGIGVISQVLEERAFESANRVRYRSLLIAGIILFLAFSIIYFFSITITRPIRLLVKFTTMIAKGEFQINARKKIKSHDEVGDLALAFDTMAEGLAEREKAMNVLSKTQGSDVAAQLMNQDLASMGGTKKFVTVLFSDLRDFTKFSEGNSPEEVVSMLNEYFEVMVSTITRNKGTVNKFIGDAIMAMWGAPNSTGNDAGLATQTALEMRIELNKLNEKRIARGQMPIKIGVGLHCGVAIAGTIGSTSRMEYTIIGDTVNQASRIEASTKAFGADILLSHEMYEKVQKNYIVEYGGSAEVKGKSEALKMYKIRGYIDDTGKPTTIKTPYSDYKAESVDKVNVAI